MDRKRTVVCAHYQSNGSRKEMKLEKVTVAKHYNLKVALCRRQSFY